MVESFKIKNITKKFDNKKTYTITLTGKDLNIIISALKIPMLPSMRFIDRCEEISKRSLAEKRELEV